MSNTKFMNDTKLTSKQVIERFNEMFSEYVLQRNARGIRVTSTDRRCLFVEFVDYLARNGMITESLANNITL